MNWKGFISISNVTLIKDIMLNKIELLIVKRIELLAYIQMPRFTHVFYSF